MFVVFSVSVYRFGHWNVVHLVCLMFEFICVAKMLIVKSENI